MATLTVTVTEDYRDGSPSVANTDAILFNGSGGVTATFDSSQFVAGQISSSVAITGDGNANQITVFAEADSFFSAANWTHASWSSNDTVRIVGDAASQTISGSTQSNNDILGGGGADFLTGGALDDKFIYTNGSDIESGEIVNGLGGTDTLFAAAIDYFDFTEAFIFNIERVNFLGASTFEFNGNQVGAGKINEFEGTLGFASTLVVNGSLVTLSGSTFTNWTAGEDLIVVNGTGGNDSLTGSSQNDTIIGGLGADTLVGGDGNDTFVYNASAENDTGETVNGGGGTADTLRVNVGGGFSLIFNAATLTGVEKVVFAAAGEVQLAGANLGAAAGLVNAVTGSAGVNRLTLFDSDVDLSGVTFTAWTAGEDSVRLSGTIGNDTITGSSQADLIRGFAGVDTLAGGGGDDRFTFDEGEIVAGESINGGGGTGDTLVMISEEAVDLRVATVTGIERLEFVPGIVGSGPLLASGSQIKAGAIATVVGFSFGAQAIIVSGTSVNLTGVTFLTWNDGEDLITINGNSAASNTLTGSNRRDTINGGSKNDTLNGGAGLDALNGGLGNDTYVLGAETGDTITDTGGVDTITSTISRSLAGFGSIEKLTLLGTAVTGTGNGLANTVLGNGRANVLNGAGGADTLNGGAAADTMRGGADGDTYIVDNFNDVVDESVAGSSGTDTVRASVSYSLASKALGAVENLTLTGAAANGTGNSFGNVITGNAAGNTLDGGDGADQLLGGDGNDRLIGGLGPDQITGGNGIDTFAFLALSDSRKKSSARDTILDFTVEDFIDLSVIDAKKGGKDNKFKFIGKDAFDGNKGELRFQKKNGDVIVSGDVNGDGKADFSILLDGTKKVAKSDFDL